ncbi:MAG: FAD-binding oxidoreductase, partial [Tranquillimonas sp.]
PARVNAALFVVPDPASSLALLAMAQQRAGGGLSAYELISGIGLHFLTEADVPVRQPFAEPPDWMVLIELGLPEALNPDDVLTDLFEAALGAGLAEDGLIAQSEGQRAEFWAMRERIPEANRRIEAIASNDIALPVSEVPDFIARSGAALAALGDMRINCFGHLGDGNLHYNIFPARGRRAADYPGMGDRARRVVDDLVAQMGGSFSAEHGIGRLKVETLERYGDPAKLAAMHAIKRALDPLGIMNPGAVLRAQD